MGMKIHISGGDQIVADAVMDLIARTLSERGFTRIAEKHRALTFTVDIQHLDPRNLPISTSVGWVPDLVVHSTDPEKHNHFHSILADEARLNLAIVLDSASDVTSKAYVEAEQRFLTGE